MNCSINKLFNAIILQCLLNSVHHLFNDLINKFIQPPISEEVVGDGIQSSVIKYVYFVVVENTNK